MPPPSTTAPVGVDAREPSLSQVIAFLRFPLISLIVLYHAFNTSVTLPPNVLDYHQPVTDFVYWHLLHDSVATAAVPLFFAISGFLYFRSGVFSGAVWREKTKKRILRLLLPLLSWSVAAFLLMAAFHALHLPNATAKMYFDAPHSPLWWLDAFLGFADPMGPRLARASWFVRDLFVVGLLSPLWHFLLKRRIAAAILLPALFALYCLWFAPLPFLGSRPMFFFNAGAFYAIWKRDVLADARRAALPCFFAWLLSVAALYVRPGLALADFLHHLLPCFLIPCILVLAASCSRKFPIPALLSSSSFFVYFAHVSLWILIPWHTLLLALFAPVADGAVLAFILLNAVGETALCFALYALLKRVFPSSLFFLAGEPLPKPRSAHE